MRALIFKVWGLDQWQWYLLGAWEKCSLSGPILDLVNQNLHFDRSPDDLYARYSFRSTGLDHVSNYYGIYNKRLGV